jgi:uncharacterized RDD family membrane protein YckC
MDEKYSTFWRRFFAGIIDGIVLMPLGFLLDMSPPSILELNGISDLTYTLFTTILFHACVYTYSIVLHWKFGQTVGKKWCDVRVVDVSETQLLTLDQSFRRDSIPIALVVLGLIIQGFLLYSGDYHPFADNFGSALVAGGLLGSANLIWFLLEIITMFTNDKCRAFHDYLAGSVVVKDEYWHGPRNQDDVTRPF